MPNRIIRESARRSETLAQLSGDEERLFWRLTTAADDYGRFDGRPAVIRAECFQVMLDRIVEADVAKWLDGLERAGLVRRYERDGKPLIHFPTWHLYQQTRAKDSKWPAPPADDDTRQQPHARASSRTHAPADSFGIGIEYEDRDAGAGSGPAAPAPAPIALRSAPEPIPEGFALAPKAREAYRMRSCSDLAGCHEHYVAHRRAEGRRLPLERWADDEVAWAYRHDDRAPCRGKRTAASAPLPDVMQRALERSGGRKGAA